MSRIAINGMGWRDRAVDIVLECMGSYRDIVGVSDEAIVSTDIIHAPPRASIIDCTLTQVIDGDLVKVMSWYDNEWGYTAQAVREAKARAALSSNRPRCQAEPCGSRGHGQVRAHRRATAADGQRRSGDTNRLVPSASRPERTIRRR